MDLERLFEEVLREGRGNNAWGWHQNRRPNYGVPLLPVPKSEVKELINEWLEDEHAGTAYIFDLNGIYGEGEEPKTICAFSAGELGDKFKLGAVLPLISDRSRRDIGLGKIIDILPTEKVNPKNYNRFAVFK